MKKKKWLVAALHIVAWALYFSLPYLMRPSPRPQGMDHFGDGKIPPPDAVFWLYFSALQNLVLIPIFYLNAHYLLPTLLGRKRYAWLILIQLAGISLYYGSNVVMSALMLPDMPGHPRLFMAFTNYLVVLSVAYGMYAYGESRRLEQRQKQREVEHIRAELQFLRWQISPHFLFNALNNMVALARKKSDNLEPMLIHLSSLLRYMIYETDGSRVSLQKEEEYLQSYIRLQSIRYSGVTLGVHMDVPENRELWLEPMLLIPFVENAFKHGIDGIESPVIKVQLQVVGNTLRFEVVNKYVPDNGSNKDDAHGVGLANVQRRLNLLYADRHSLEITVDNWYTIHLKIELV